MIVRKLKDAPGYERLLGIVATERQVATCFVSYHDGRREEIECDPYPVAEQIDIGSVERLLVEGIWGVDELTAYGLATAEPFVPPAGTRAIGEPSYVEIEGVVREVYDREDIPPPPPPPTREEKVARLLDDYGLTLNDLAAAIIADAEAKA